nr:hypothetical protein [uncultured Pseudodesulfovibrio sp.]
MSSRVQIPRIKAFPKDGRKWQIDWLGAIKANSQQSIEPTIEVIIRPLGGRSSSVNEEGAQQDVVDVGVGLLPFLRVGSVWLNGRSCPGFLGFSRTFKQITISSKSVISFRANDYDPELGKGYYIVPKWEYEFGKNGLNSQCLAIKNNDDPYGIILPAIEAIRFYYAGSTNLTSLSLFGAYDNYLTDIINPEKSGYLIEQERCVLRLRRWITDDDGWTIGRVLHEPLAKAGVQRIYQSILPYSVEGACVYPTCSFPFEGETRWMARGIWIETIPGKRRFLIFELTRCSSPFPFKQLHVTRDNDGRKAAKETDIPEDEKQPCWTIPKSTTSLKGKEAELQTGTDPQRYVKPMLLDMIGERFDELSGKEIIKTEKIENPYKSGQLAGLHSVPIESLSTGKEVGGKQPVGPVKVQEITRRKGAEPSFEILLEASEILNMKEGFTASMRSVSYDQFVTPRLKPENRRQWPYLDFKTKALRCVWGMDIVYNEISYCFVDYELRRKGERTAGLLRNLNGSEITYSDFGIILHGLSISEGNWENLYFIQHDLVAIKRKHTWINGEQCAEAIATMIMGS